MRNKKQAIVLCQLAAFILLFVSVAPALASTETNQIVVPFQFYRHEVLIQVTINGQGPFPMLLDTGTNSSVIDLSLAQRLGLALTPAGRGGSGGGVEKILLKQRYCRMSASGAFPLLTFPRWQWIYPN